ncbi:uncharacterized protein J5F26_008818 [Ciconia maguari]
MSRPPRVCRGGGSCPGVGATGLRRPGRAEQSGAGRSAERAGAALAPLPGRSDRGPRPSPPRRRPSRRPPAAAPGGRCGGRAAARPPGPESGPGAAAGGRAAAGASRGSPPSGKGQSSWKYEVFAILKVKGTGRRLSPTNSRVGKKPPR